jgi:Zn-dependent protease/CBS domain-containing protein
MFGSRVRLFRLFGFSVGVDLSWIFLAILVTWSLSTVVFPQMHPDLDSTSYWIMGIIGAVGLFLSIILHELGHSFVARQFGIPINEITLFIFGGVAEMEDEPPDAKSEFLMAIAGPATSFLIAGVLLAFQYVVAPRIPATPLMTVIRYLFWLNLVVAFFNLLPAFPLDGGRVLRSILWHVKANLKWATRVASSIGSAFGTGLIVLGLLVFVGGSIVQGLWWFMIGMFMRAASSMSYRQVLIRRMLRGETVRQFMKADPVSVAPYVSLHDLVENYIYRHHYKLFPVVQDGGLVGYITARDVSQIPREEWEQRTVDELMHSYSTGNTIGPDEDAMKALAAMSRSGNSRLMVVENGKLVGIIALKDMLNFLSLKFDLENEEAS